MFEKNLNKEFLEFYKIYKKKPIDVNDGGMKMPHMFGLYCFVKKINPKFIIESGTFRGQSSWLLEQISDAKILTIDIYKYDLLHKSSNITYSNLDFRFHDFSDYPTEDTLLVFDDHINASERFIHGRYWKFKHFIFEDNYPSNRGDTPSFKQFFNKSFDGWGKNRIKKIAFKEYLLNYFKNIMRSILSRKSIHPEMNISNSIRYNPNIINKILSNLPISYYEFPQLIKCEESRWGTNWLETYGNENICLIEKELDKEIIDDIKKELKDYTSISYLKFED